RPQSKLFSTSSFFACKIKIVFIIIKVWICLDVKKLYLTNMQKKPRWQRQLMHYG
ncbi:hypothetical protein Mgra_00007610, partial [Meloidogyne graminicola]